MFEQTLEEMKAIHYISPEMYQQLTASNVGVNPEIIFHGDNEYTYHQARDVISALDKALIGCAKHLQKRIRAERLSFTFAFGPEMEEVCGRPPELRK
jgi:hypothetical protein